MSLKSTIEPPLHQIPSNFPYLCVVNTCMSILVIFRGCPSEKNSYQHCFSTKLPQTKGCKLQNSEKIYCFGHDLVKKKEAGKRKMTDCHSAKLIRYQMQPVIFKNCTISVNQQASISQRVSRFSCILIVINL